MSKFAKTSSILVLISLLLNFALITPGHADLLGLIGGKSIEDATKRLDEMINKTVKDFLRDLEALSNGLLDKGHTAGSLLTIQASNEMKVLIGTARAEFGNELDKQVNSASKELKAALIHLERWEMSQRELESSVVGLVDLVSLDLQNALPSRTVGVRRLNGGVFVQNDPTSFYFDLVGLDFGSDPAGVQTAFTVTLNGQPLAPPERKAPINAIFRIPRSDMERLFQKDNIVVLPLNIRVARQEQKRLWGMFPWWGRDERVATYDYKVSLMPDLVGKVTITTRYPGYSWQALRPAEHQSFTVRGDTLVSSLVTLSVPKPALGGDPELGNMRIEESSFSLVCQKDDRPARQFPNGKIRLASDEIFRNGFVTARWRGAAGGDRNDSDNAMNAEMMANFGFTVPLTCAESEHCRISKDELLKRSVDATLDVSGCRHMRSEKPDFRNNSSEVIVWVRGTPVADIPGTYVDARWQVSWQPLTWAQKPELIRGDPQVLSVYASFPLEFEIVDQPGGTTSDIRFEPTVGKPENVGVGSDITPNFRRMGQDRVGNRTVYKYKFEYPRLQ
ncbi:hypothetical protein OZ411_15220 [Bradyrhizobium sp. Arg237L]|uniref:hypothetical protein n=1 Tax=Bradyrhizobium sp. Arg237L TaxID=3003352 RepID=UPI00249E41F2|nr:hypothetical protein [Bradyrhizobium sp. Arg237L]MDI4234163.1 hypothetical protein [Bradyrhizobium sp. Arg237L]